MLRAGGVFVVDYFARAALDGNFTAVDREDNIRPARRDLADSARRDFNFVLLRVVDDDVVAVAAVVNENVRPCAALERIIAFAAD